MSRFSSFFKRLQALDRESRRAPFFYALILLAFLAYVLPWLHNPGQALTLGGYDLAEWLSLHPGVRSQTPPLLASLLLRLHVTLIAALIAVWIPRRLWLIICVCVGLLTIAQLPPPEFLSQRSDMNYQQQLGLAVLTPLLCAALIVWNRRSLSTLILALIGVSLCMWGVSQAQGFMQVFSLPAWIGLGAPLLAGVYLAMIGVVMRQWQIEE